RPAAAPGKSPGTLRPQLVLAAAEADELHTRRGEPPDVVPRREHVGGIDHDGKPGLASDGQALLERDRRLPGPVPGRPAKKVEHRGPFACHTLELGSSLDLDDANPGVAHRMVVTV